MSATRTVEVTRTYLQMFAPTEAISVAPAPEDARLERVAWCPVAFYRYLYGEVGKNYHWVDRLVWSEATLRAYLDDPTITLWVLYVGAAPAGYVEFKAHVEENSVQIAYFGLTPEFIGRGLGKYLLSRAIEIAWTRNPTRLWLDTCTLDDPAALPNYRRRGFAPYRQETYTTELTEAEWERHQRQQAEAKNGGTLGSGSPSR